MKKKHKHQRKLRKCERKIKTKAMAPRGFRHNFGVNGFAPPWNPNDIKFKE